MDRIKCLAVDRLPAGLPVAITQVGNSVYVYMSRQYDVDQIAEALEAASNVRQQMIVNVR